MVPSSDEHLESALKEYNDKVNYLEENGTQEELMEAYVNRGCVLSMMEYYVSAISDFDDAIDIMNDMMSRNMDVDPGTYVKAHVSRGELRGDDSRAMADDYLEASRMLDNLDDGSKYYDRRTIIRMCISCCEDLLENDYPVEMVPFIDKLYKLLVAKDDIWSQNRYLELLSMKARADLCMGRRDMAMEGFTDAIEKGTELINNARLEDLMALVFPLVERGDLEQEAGLLDMYFIDRKAAIVLLEQLLSENRLDDIGILAALHKDLANTYLTLNKVKEAEEHLMKQVVLNVDGAGDYIRNFADRPDFH